MRDREEEVDQLRGGVVGEVERDGDVHNCTHRKDVGLRCAAESPRILGVPVPSGPGGNGRWSSGETLEVTVTFTEAVVVDTSSGTPSIEVRLGDATTRRAACVRGSETIEYVFAHELVAPDGAHAAVHVSGDSLVLRGGRIRSEATGAMRCSTIPERDSQAP